MRIAIISTLESVPWTGCEELWAATAAAALDEGHRVYCSVCRWPTTPEKIDLLENRGAAIQKRRRRRLPSVDGFVSRVAGRPVSIPRPSWLGWLSTFKEIFRCDPDVVLISQAGTYDYHKLKDVVAWLERTDVPFVVVSQLNMDYHFPENRNFRRAQKFFARASHVGFVSEHNLKLAERQLAFRFHNASVLQNPVNLADQSAVPWPRSSALKLACVARLDVNHKAQDILFEALAAAPWRERTWTLTICGTGPDEEYLKRLARHYDLSGRVFFAGHVSDIRAIWAEHHVGVLSSRWEGTPLALVEGILCGRPFVVTDAGGNAEWIAEGSSGFVAEAPTPHALGMALERAWQNRERWEALGVSARESALLKLDPAPGKTLLDLLVRAARAEAN